MRSDVYIEDLLAPNYDALLEDVLAHKHSQYMLKGGRGSLKSSFTGFVIPLIMLEHPDVNALILRKTAKTLRDSVFWQMQFAIDKLGLSDEFTCRVSPMQIKRETTGQVILFRGLDDPMKIKSIKAPRGYFGVTWFEEADQFSGMKEIRSVLQSARRGGDLYWNFMTFNPPETQSNFMNEEVLRPTHDTLVHSSDYRSVPPEWLGQQFFNDALELALINSKAYRHEYLGEVTGTGGEVFDNLVIREITDSEIATFGSIYFGLDFGWYPDPAHWVKCCYNPAQLTLYIFDELRAIKTSNAELWRRLQEEKGMTESDPIIADSAEPKSVSDLRSYGCSCRGAEKGPDSVRYSMKWLQSLKAIVIDPARCPETAREFTHYEYERTADGDVVSGYPDANNHSIDAVRYALNRVWKRKGQ
jgi:PBSX family phage terminase large subunit